MNWNVVLTEQAEAWMKSLSTRDRSRMARAFDQIAQQGPSLGRPVVDTVTGSRHRNMKEARSVGGHLRALFAFDEHRTAVVLVGGNKEHRWKSWYRENIPKADRLFNEHKRNTRGKIRWREAGARSAGR